MKEQQHISVTEVIIYQHKYGMPTGDSWKLELEDIISTCECTPKELMSASFSAESLIELLETGFELEDTQVIVVCYRNALPATYTRNEKWKLL